MTSAFALAALAVTVLFRTVTGGVSGTSENIPRGIGASTVDGPAHRTPPAAPRHFIFFGRMRERIHDSAFVTNTRIAGAQIKYMWRELEPARDQYDFRKVLEDIAALAKQNKSLVIQLQDVNFIEDNNIVPDYLLTDPAFNGGVARKYEGDSPTEPARFDGLVVRRWDPAVRGRFNKLLQALGAAVDGKIAAINLAETAIGFGESGKFHPAGFTSERYAEGIKSIMSAARAAFVRTPVIVYANFMPGTPSTGNALVFLRDIYNHAESIGVGVGGPDLLPHRRWQRLNSLPLIASRRNGIPAGVAVQDGNLAEVNTETGKRVTVAELYRYAADSLKLDFIFWGTEEPYYSRDILPFILSGAN